MKSVKSFLLALAVCVGLAPCVWAAAGQFPVDPCQGEGRQTVPISVATAGTSSLIAPVTGAYIYICGMSLTTSGGTGTLEYGTGSTCGTGTTTLTGPIAASTTITNFPAGVSLIQVQTKSQRLCYLAGSGASATSAGWLTYVQTPVQGY